MTGEARRRGYPDEFYMDVAAEYRRGYTAGPRIARRWDVPLTTANRWIAEARRRGALEPTSPRCSGRCHAHCPP